MTTPKAGIALSVWPDGNKEAWGNSRQFEYHTPHHEIFVLSGAFNFDNRYRVGALGYINRPPFWVHPANVWAEGRSSLLIRDYQPPIVQFETIPSPWDIQEGFAAGQPTRCRGVTKLQIDELSWSRLHAVSGRETGVMAKRIWDDLDHGWTTWLMCVPAGWEARGPLVQVPGGDEIFVIEGDLELRRPSSSTLRAMGYVCDTHVLADGARSLASTAGATFIRWTRGGDMIWREAGVGGRV